MSTDQAETERLEAMLSDYVEGTLSLADRQELEKHLAADPALREQLEETREAQKALRSLNKTPAPDDKPPPAAGSEIVPRPLGP